MKSAIFDLDGTIIDSEKAHLDTFNMVLDRFGIYLSEDDWFPLKGLGSREIFRKIFSEKGIKVEDVDVLIKERDKLLVKRIGEKGLPVVNGFMALYDNLKKRGVKIIIATSGHRFDVKEELKSIGLDEQEFVCANDVERLKPYPDIFLLAAERLGERPSDCVVFEDSEAGVLSGKKAGMYVVGVLATSDMKQLERADKIVKDFTVFTEDDLNKLLL